MKGRKIACVLVVEFGRSLADIKERHQPLERTARDVLSEVELVLTYTSAKSEARLLQQVERRLLELEISVGDQVVLGIFHHRRTGIRQISIPEVVAGNIFSRCRISREPRYKYVDFDGSLVLRQLAYGRLLDRLMEDLGMPVERECPPTHSESGEPLRPEDNY